MLGSTLISVGKIPIQKRIDKMDMYGSGSRRANMTHKKSEEISVVLKCWLFSFDG
jgi:hypothetical protein